MPVYVFNTFNDPFALTGTTAGGVNDTDQIVGNYSDASGRHGFLESSGVFTPIAIPWPTTAPLHSASTIWARSSGLTTSTATSPASETTASS